MRYLYVYTTTSVRRDPAAIAGRVMQIELACNNIHNLTIPLLQVSQINQGSIATIHYKIWIYLQLQTDKDIKVSL